MSTEKKASKKQATSSRCGNPNGCYRPANGTDGIGWCGYCEDDSGNNQPMNDKLRKQYEPEWTPWGLVWIHKVTGESFKK